MTLFNWVLNNREGRRLVIIVNDMCEVDMNADLSQAETRTLACDRFSIPNNLNTNI